MPLHMEPDVIYIDQGVFQHRLQNQGIARNFCYIVAAGVIQILDPELDRRLGAVHEHLDHVRGIRHVVLVVGDHPEVDGVAILDQVGVVPAGSPRAVLLADVIVDLVPGFSVIVGVLEQDLGEQHVALLVVIQPGLELHAVVAAGAGAGDSHPFGRPGQVDTTWRRSRRNADPRLGMTRYAVVVVLHIEVEIMLPFVPVVRAEPYRAGHGAVVLVEYREHGFLLAARGNLYLEQFAFLGSVHVDDHPVHLVPPDVVAA